MNNTKVAIEPKVLEAPQLSDKESLKQWIEKQQKNYKLQYLLAHAEDGVIWGKFENDKLVTAECLWDQSPPLKPTTLQQCRIFGKEAEVMLWRKEDGWQARVIQDAPEVDCIIEKQMLWGNQIEKSEKGFTLLTDGQQGMRHAVPITDISIDPKKSKSSPRLVYLHVKHYVNYDTAGIAFIRWSRLLDITAKQPKF
jgi:CRISPR-associated protein (TIGR03984 family)